MVDLWSYSATSVKTNFIAQIKAPILLEAVLAIVLSIFYKSYLKKILKLAKF